MCIRKEIYTTTYDSMYAYPTLKYSVSQSFDLLKVLSVTRPFTNSKLILLISVKHLVGLVTHVVLISVYGRGYNFEQIPISD